MAKEKEATEMTKGGQGMQPVTPTRALSPFEEMDRMLESFFPRGWMRPSRWEIPSWGMAAGYPRVDVIDRDDEVLVRAEIPGISKDDLEISVNESHVTIKGTAAHEEEEERGDFYRCEIARGAFSRTIALPAEVDGERAKARFNNGLLELTIPKVEKSKRHTIKVE
jgi:HSP20 family protein